jgi:hypothetical protein
VAKRRAIRIFVSLVEKIAMSRAFGILTFKYPLAAPFLRCGG